MSENLLKTGFDVDHHKSGTALPYINKFQIELTSIGRTVAQYNCLITLMHAINYFKRALTS